MLAANIKTEVRKILEEKGDGWLRVEKCALEYAKDPLTQEVNESRKTRFYRWRKKVEDGKVDGFQVLKFSGNVSFIGLDSADPSRLERYIPANLIDRKSFRDAFLKNCFKQLEKISQQAVYGHLGNWGEPCKALHELLFLIARLPKEIKEGIKPLENKVTEIVDEKLQELDFKEKKSPYGSEKRTELLEEYESTCLEAVRLLIDEVSTLLHEYHK